MKKLLVAVLAVALFAPAFAVENVQVTGDIQTIGVALNDRGVTPVGELRATTNRVLLGLNAELVEDVTARVTFAHRNVFGTDLQRGESVNNVWNTTFLAEAYVNIANVFDALEVKVGRQFYGNEKSAVMYFGPDYGYAVGNSYTSLDGVTARYNGENFALTAAYFSLNNNDLTRDAGDRNIGGLDLDLKLNENITANAYVYDVRTEAAAAWGFWGVKPTLEYEHFKLGAEFARNYGQIEKGWQVKADLALPMGTDDTTITPRVTYLKSEKNFVAMGNYRPGLMFGTMLALMPGATGPINNFFGGAINNWEIINAGLCMKFGFGLDFYTGEQDNAFTGNSWEAKVVYNHNQYVAFDLTGAILTNYQGHSWKHSPVAVQLGMNVKF